VPFFFILSLRQAGHLISRVIRISLFYQNPTCFFSAYFLKHHPNLIFFQAQRCLGFFISLAENFLFANLAAFPVLRLRDSSTKFLHEFNNLTK
jgi:hypothetical protein